MAKYYIRAPKNDGEREKKRAAKAVSLWNYGLTSSAICERFGCADSTLQRWLREAGIRRDGTRREHSTPAGGSVGFRSLTRIGNA